MVHSLIRFEANLGSRGDSSRRRRRPSDLVVAPEIEARYVRDLRGVVTRSSTPKEREPYRPIAVEVVGASNINPLASWGPIDEELREGVWWFVSLIDTRVDEVTTTDSER